MKIVVCIKPVKSEIVLSNYKGEEKYQINPYDLKALEEITKLKNKIDCHIIAMSMGSNDAKDVLTKALAIGADEAILLSDKVFSGSDTIATTYALKQAIEKVGHVNLIVCGAKSLDGETGQVVYGVGERLGINHIFSMDKILDISNDDITLQKREKNKIIDFKIGFPALIYCQGFKLRSDNLSLLALKRAGRQEIKVWNAKDILVDETRCGIEGSKTKVLEVKSALIKKEGASINGSIGDISSFLRDLIIKKKVELETNG